MRFNLISNISNGCGLQRDYELFRQALEARGHTVAGVQFNQKPFVIRPADVNVFLEVVNPTAFSAAPQQWAIPNPEWWFAGWDQYSWDRVLAKTRDCERIFQAKVGHRCQYIGWEARDFYRAEIPRERKFLHVAGKSHFKNTQAVIAGCRMAEAPLTLVGEQFGRRVSEDELTTLMNSHFCHVMPSAYEGYGQVLHEAQGCGQVIITTQAPPMNEVTPAILVPSTRSRPHHAGVLHLVDDKAVSRAVTHVAQMSEATVTEWRANARAQYQQDRLKFHQALDALVGTP